MVDTCLLQTPVALCKLMQLPPKLTLTTVHPYFVSVLFPILEGFAICYIFGYAQSGLLLVTCISQVLVIGLF